MRRFAVLLMVVLFAPLLAFAQVVADPAPATNATTALGWVYLGALSLLLLTGAWAVSKVGALLSAKAEQAGASTIEQTAWGIANRIWVKVQAAGSKVLAREKPLLEKILADGKVTAEEFDLLKRETVLILREVAAEEISQLGPALKIFGDGPVTHFLEGMAARVVAGLLTGKTQPITQAVPK